MNSLGLTDPEKWNYITTTMWQLSYDHMIDWLNRFDTLDEAFEAAQKERDGMVAT